MWLYSEISSRYHRLLIYDEKLTKIDGMCPVNDQQQQRLLGLILIAITGKRVNSNF